MRYLKRKLGIFLLIFCMAFSFLAATAPTEIMAEERSSADWMADVNGETMLSSMSIPGTHDTCTQYVGMSYIFKCQNTSVAEQLENGYRYLDMRLVLDGKGDKQTLILKHNFSKCKKSGWIFSKALSLEAVLSDVYAFLEAHPGETVIMCMKAESSKDDVAQVQKLLYDAIEENEDAWYLANEIPTLDEVRGKIVLATRFDDEMKLGDEKSGLHFYWEDQGDRTIVSQPYAESAINDETALSVQDRYNYDVSDKIDAIETSLENSQASDDCFFLNFTSTSGSGKVGHPKKYAKKINAYLSDYDWEAGSCYGIVIVDFADRDLAEKIYGTNLAL